MLPRRVEKIHRGPGPVKGSHVCQSSGHQTDDDEGSNQQYIPPSEQQVQEPRKYTGGAIPSRSFRMLQALTAGPENCVNDSEESSVPKSHGGYDQPGVESWGQCPCPSPYPKYWTHPESWWGYYSHNESLPQYWDPYAAMYAYMTEMNGYGYPSIPYPPPIYSPHHFMPPHPPMHCRHGQGSSDSDEFSGYSSTDEMAYYSANFCRKPVPVVNNIRPDIVPNSSYVTSAKGECEQTKYNSPQVNGKNEETSGSDTEVEGDDEKNDNRSLMALHSVSDISIYKSGSEILSNSSDANEGGSEHEDETDEEEEDEYEDDDDYEVILIKEENTRTQDSIPHQLSVIFEESEQSDISTRHDEDTSTAIVEDSDIDFDLAEPSSSTVTVCLPLKLKFSRSENDEEVTTVIVGDSHVKPTEIVEDKKDDSLSLDITSGSTDISVTLSFSSTTKLDIGELQENKQVVEEFEPVLRQVSTSDMDCYETAESDSDVSVCLSLPLRKKQQNIHKHASENSPCQIVEEEEDDKTKNEESDSAFTHYEDDSSSIVSIQNTKHEESRGRSSSSEAETVIFSGKTNTPPVVTIKETENVEINSEESENEERSEDESSSSSSCQSNISNLEGNNKKKDVTESIVSKIYDMCVNDEEKEKMAFEESEEDDSGVTSDVSRHVSDVDTESDELIRCQRASTHSRLFKLLQDECAAENIEDVLQKPRRECLTLPLHTGSDPDSLSSSSGVASPSSPTITDRLVKELIHTLLQRKKGKRLKKLPLAKLHAAALRILQEDMDPYDTGSSITSEENSPVQQPNHMPSQTDNSIACGGTNYYYDYCDYYNSWANAAAYYSTNSTFDYNVIPSRAFQLFREHVQPGGFSSGIIDGLWAKCPRIQSSKNVHKDLKVLPEEQSSLETDINTSSSETRPQSPDCAT